MRPLLEARFRVVVPGEHAVRIAIVEFRLFNRLRPRLLHDTKNCAVYAALMQRKVRENDQTGLRSSWERYKKYYVFGEMDE